jgi:hypothetical protein
MADPLTLIGLALRRLWFEVESGVDEEGVDHVGSVLEAFGRFFTMAARWSVPVTMRFPRLRLRWDQTCSVG